MSQQLQYNYALIDLETGRCIDTFTQSYEIPSSMTQFIEIPILSDEYDYGDKYYNLNGDQMWYWDAEFTQLWEECPSHNV